VAIHLQPDKAINASYGILTMHGRSTHTDYIFTDIRISGDLRILFIVQCGIQSYAMYEIRVPYKLLAMYSRKADS